MQIANRWTRGVKNPAWKGALEGGFVRMCVFGSNHTTAEQKWSVCTAGPWW